MVDGAIVGISTGPAARVGGGMKKTRLAGGFGTKARLAQAATLSMTPISSDDIMRSMSTRMIMRSSTVPRPTR